MSYKHQIAAVSVALLLAACSMFESTEEKQVRACMEDIKLGLNDPSSLEVVSAKSFKVNDSIYRVQVEFTAKNKFGGRVRSKEICGFGSDKNVALDKEDIMNKEREMNRQMRELGIKLN